MSGLKDSNPFLFVRYMALHGIICNNKNHYVGGCSVEVGELITKNGNGHLVIMSQQLYEEQQALLDLYDKLDEAKEQSRAGKRRPFLDVMAELRSRIHAKISN